MATMHSQFVPLYGQDAAPPTCLDPLPSGAPAAPPRRPRLRQGASRRDASRRDACVRALGMLLLVAGAAQVPENALRWPGPIGGGHRAAVTPPVSPSSRAAEPAGPVADAPEDVSRVLRVPVPDVPEDVSRAL